MFFFFRFLFLYFALSLYCCELSYGGLTIPCCEWGCGQLGDPKLDNIGNICLQTVRTIFEEADDWLLNEQLHHREVNFWKYEYDGLSYEVYNWEKTSGRWEEHAYESVSIDEEVDFQKAANRLRKDLLFYHLQLPEMKKNLYQNCIKRLRKGLEAGYENFYYWKDEIGFEYLYLCPRKTPIEDEIDYLNREIEFFDAQALTRQEKYEEASAVLERAIREIDKVFKYIFVNCLRDHQPEGISFKGAVEDFIASDYGAALKKIQFLIDFAEKQKLSHELIAKLQLLEGQFELEFCQYSAAVVSLTSAIQKNPAQKEAYFERAVAYFELGEFDKAIEDYLVAGSKKPSLLTTVSLLSAGITVGIIEGAAESTVSFVPETLSTLHGMGKGLWALLEEPSQASQAFVDAALQLVDYLRSQSALQIVQDLVPELKQLVQNYDQLTPYEKGKLIGHVIGKYGADILICKYSMTALKAYRDLKRANQAMTLEALANPKSTQQMKEAARKVWAVREEVKKNGNLKIQWDKQNKHIQGKHNYKLGGKKSIFEHSDPQRLVDKYAGTGVREASNVAPGTAGYKEIVDFEEFIGYAVDDETGALFRTTIGKIHYAKDGVHIVPRKGI